MIRGSLMYETTNHESPTTKTTSLQHKLPPQNLRRTPPDHHIKSTGFDDKLALVIIKTKFLIGQCKFDGLTFAGFQHDFLKAFQLLYGAHPIIAVASPAKQRNTKNYLSFSYLFPTFIPTK